MMFAHRGHAQVSHDYHAVVAPRVVIGVDATGQVLCADSSIGSKGTSDPDLMAERRRENCRAVSSADDLPFVASRTDFSTSSSRNKFITDFAHGFVDALALRRIRRRRVDERLRRPSRTGVLVVVAR